MEKKTAVFNGQRLEIFAGPVLGKFHGFVAAHCFEFVIGPMETVAPDQLALVDVVSGFRFVEIQAEELQAAGFNLYRAATAAFLRQVAAQGPEKILRIMEQAHNEFPS